MCIGCVCVCDMSCMFVNAHIMLRVCCYIHSIYHVLVCICMMSLYCMYVCIIACMYVYTQNIYAHISVYIYSYVYTTYVLFCAGVYMIYLGVCTCNLGVCMCNVCIVVSFPNQSSFTLSHTHPHSRPFLTRSTPPRR